MTLDVSPGSVQTRAAELAEGLRALLAMVERHPELVDHPGFAQRFAQMPIPVHGDDALEAVSLFAVAAGEVGGGVDHDMVSDDVWASIDVRLSPAVCLWVYGSREQLAGEREGGDPS